MTRRESREYALILIYEYLFQPDKETEEIISDVTEAQEVAPSGFAKEIFEGVTANKYSIDELIAASSDNWNIERIGKVSFAALEMCVWEMKYNKTEASIAVNECLEICRRFADDKDVSFVNGVLGKASKLITEAV